MRLSHFVLWCSACLTAAGWPKGVAAADQVGLTCWAQHVGTQISYSYKLDNFSDRAVSNFRLGFIPSGPSSNGRAELSVMPSGELTGPWISAASARGPQGWAALVDFAEESEYFSVEWVEASYVEGRYPAMVGKPGAPEASTSSGPLAAKSGRHSFTIMVDKEDPAYVYGHALIAVGQTYVPVPIVRGDREAPVVRLNVQRLDQNGPRGSWALFSVKADVTDNFDPQPATEL